MKQVIDLVAVIVLCAFLGGCQSESNSAHSNGNELTSPKQDAGLEIGNNAKVFYTFELTDRSHVSDGTDRARNGKRRFLGPMGARAASFNGYQYVIYYEGKDRSLPKSEQAAEVVVARRNLANNDIERATLQGHLVTSEDAHNRQAIAIAQSDGSIHIAFDHHNERALRYARTVPGVANSPQQHDWNDNVFEFMPNFGDRELDGIQVTYPDFTEFPGGDLILYFRHGGSYGGDMQLTKYDGSTQKWSPIRTLSSRYGTYRKNADTRGPYLSDGIRADAQGNLKMSWLFREKTGGCDLDGRVNQTETFCNHGLYFAQSQDGGVTWYSHDSQLIADTNKGESLNVENVVPPIEVPPELAPTNVSNNSAIDPKTGDYHVLLSHLEKRSDNTRKIHHYVGRANNTWTGRVSSFSASDVKIAFVDDYMLAFGARSDVYIRYARRDEGFENWYNLPIVQDTKNFVASGGYASWDFGRLSQGIASLIWHTPSQSDSDGTPSSILVYDIQFATAN